jgi:hypothetical protein
MTPHPPLINPGPVAHPAKNTHRVGASNHHHNSGSGENPMVDATPEPSRPADDPADAVLSAGVTADAIARHRDALATALDRNLLVGGIPSQGKTHAWRVVLAALTAENTELREQLESATAELDAANDAVVELIGQLEEAGVPVTSVVTTVGGA